MNEDHLDVDGVPEEDGFVGQEENVPEDEIGALDTELSGKSDMEVTDNDKLWALLAYVLTPFVSLIILMTDKKERPFLKAHNTQALIWGVFLSVVALLSSFLCGFPAILLWMVGCYWGYQAYQGEMVNIPVITQFVSDNTKEDAGNGDGS